MPTWGQLIGCFNSSDAVQQTIPYTFQYEMNYLGGNKYDEETLKKEICSQLSVFSQVDLKDAAEKLLSFLTKNEITDILTTNYDGLIEHLLLSQNAKLISKNNSETIYSIRMVWYLGSIYKKYHTLIYENSSELPAIEMKKLAIDYNEIYQKAMDDYISAITYGRKHAITASFVLPSLIEQGLSTNLQNRLLFKSICSLPDERNLSRPLDTEEQEYISAFLHNTRNFQFNASESYVMGKMYELFVREGVLKASAEMEMILTGVGHERQKKLTRTLNTLLKTNFARKEIRTEYLELMKDLFVKLNIRNSIMHGVGETFDYLNLGIVSIMFQLIWDIATCEIFKDEV